MHLQTITITRLGWAILYFLLICAKSRVLSGQETGSQAPEVDLYVQLNPLIRIQLMSSYTGSFPADEWTANPTFIIETALKPILRLRLRRQPDVFRKRLLTFRAGYRYVREVASSASTHENRGIVESLARYAPLALLHP
jgi:hypothetical protein